MCRMYTPNILGITINQLYTHAYNILIFYWLFDAGKITNEMKKKEKKLILTQDIQQLQHVCIIDIGYSIILLLIQHYQLYIYNTPQHKHWRRNLPSIF